MTKKLKFLTILVASATILWTVSCGVPSVVQSLAASANGRSDEGDDSNSEGLEQFHADGMGTLVGLDTDQQTATIKGSFIGGHATLTFTLGNDIITSPAVCAFKRGNAVITGTDGKTIIMRLAGVGCGTPDFTGNTEVTYVIAGGTKGATGGTGRFSFGEEPPVAGVVTFFVQFDGNIKLQEE